MLSKTQKSGTMNLLSRREVLEIGLASGLAGLVGGCNSEFFKTDFITKKADKIIKAWDEIIRGYNEETGTISPPHPKREFESFYTENEDGITLFYNVEFAGIADLEKVVKEQVKDSVISALPNSNQLIVTVKNKNQLGFLEKILGKADVLPPQILLKFTAYADFGNKAQDYATELTMAIRSKGEEEFAALTDSSQFPGAAEIVRGRINMGSKWGIQVGTSTIDLKTMLDVMATEGYVEHLFQTYLLLSNGKKGGLSGEEKLPIPEQILAGVTPVVTNKMESSKSYFEGTATIYNSGYTNLVYRAGVGSSKRPDIRRPDFQVPVIDEVFSDGIIAPIGVPIITGGKLIDIEAAMTRRDAIIPLFGSKYHEKRRARVYYEIIPYRVVIWDTSALEEAHSKYTPLRPAPPPRPAGPNENDVESDKPSKN
ncbi:hypothetical protein A3K73_09275 [Candidatus Pacearchaeota archaeon RBG_13_36_9]|nr:MAG: hypothetical protein A3K73_09275 [Candidatus Pacearchaeota archaeon RBG_13_36_9]